MKDWFNNPIYTPLRNRLIDQFRSGVFYFRNTNKLIFLCGSIESDSREYLSKFISRFHPKFLTFYAEDVWNDISGYKGLNALQMEDKLAEIADAIIIVTESPGTYTELGAFSLSTELRNKLLPIVDKKYKHSESFINTGPIKWVNKDSKFKPAIYTDLNSILLGSAEELTNRLKKIKMIGEISNIQSIADNPKHLLFLIFDLLSIISPASQKHIELYLNKITNIKPTWETSSLISLGKALRVIDSFEFKQEKLYYRILGENIFKPFIHKEMFELENERAVILNSLMKIEESRDSLKILRMKADEIN